MSHGRTREDDRPDRLDGGNPRDRSWPYEDDMATSVVQRVSLTMEPILSNVSTCPRNEPRDLQSRLYREIGISAVAAALEASDTVAQASAREKRERQVRRAA